MLRDTKAQMHTKVGSGVDIRKRIKKDAGSYMFAKTLLTEEVILLERIRQSGLGTLSLLIATSSLCCCRVKGLAQSLYPRAEDSRLHQIKPTNI